MSNATQFTISRVNQCLGKFSISATVEILHCTCFNFIHHWLHINILSTYITIATYINSKLVNTSIKKANIIDGPQLYYK